MEVAEYKNKYDLENTYKFDRDDFIKDISADFYEAIDPVLKKKEAGEAPDLKEFSDLTRTIREKWDAIFKNTQVKKEGAQKFWGFFYATVVAKSKNSLFPDLPRKKK